MVLKILLLICSFGLGACIGVFIMALMLNASRCSRWEEYEEKMEELKKLEKKYEREIKNNEN